MTNLKNLRVLVTGATGFLGGNVLKALAAHPNLEPIAGCRRREKLSRDFKGEIRIGDLRDAEYRRQVVHGVDVVCNCGNWASMWNHKALEHERFFEPTRDLIDQSVRQGVSRFIQTSTLAISAPTKGNQPTDDFAETRHTGFWPHLDCLVDLDRYMQLNSHRGTQMVTLRLGHFVGAGNRLGTVPALAPRLRTYLVPWLAGGSKRFPIVADADLAEAFVRAVLADGLDDYESFNICGSEIPTLREVVEFIAAETGFPKPLYSVPYPAGYAFAWLMETLKPILPGSSPFLTRSIVYLCENWICESGYAQRKIGYQPKKDWRTAVREHLADLKAEGFPWPRLSQTA